MHAYGDNLCEFFLFIRQSKMRVQSHSHPSRGRFSCTCTSSTAGALVTPSTSLSLSHFEGVGESASQQKRRYTYMKKTSPDQHRKKEGKNRCHALFIFRVSRSSYLGTMMIPVFWCEHCNEWRMPTHSTSKWWSLWRNWTVEADRRRRRRQRRRQEKN